MSTDINQPDRVANGRHHLRHLLETMTWELIPMKSFDKAVMDLPPASTVSVTCSPVKGIEDTMRAAERVVEAGHVPIPHIAARMVSSRQETDTIARWLRDNEIETLYLIGGDAPDPAGPYTEAFAFLADLLDADPGVSTVGVGSYPDGHALIDTDILDEVLLKKQELLASAGVHSYMSTQMCFDDAVIVAWFERQRSRGITMPAYLGVPGVINQAKLLSMGVRLGIGASLRFLRKNRSSVSRMLAPGGYDPNQVLEPLAPELERLGIAGVHCFTFNQVEATRAWVSAEIEDLG